MSTPSAAPDQRTKAQSPSPAAPKAPATGLVSPSKPPIEPPRGWIGGAVLVALLALVALGAHGLLFGKAMHVETAKAAWEAGLAQRTAERNRIDDEVEAERSSLGRVKAEIGLADQELGSRKADTTALETVRRKTGEMRESLATASEELARARLAKDQAEKATTELETRKASLSGETTQLAEQRTQLVSDVAKARTELEGLAKQAADHTTTRVEKSRLDGLVADLQTQVRALEAQRDQLTKAVASLEQQRAEGQTLASTAATLRGEKAAVELALADLKKQKEAMEKEVAEARQAATTAKRDQQIADKAAADAEAAKLAAEKARRAEEQAATDAVARTADADKTRLVADARLQQVREALAGAEAALQAKLTLVVQKEKELQALEERIRKAQAEPNPPKTPEGAGEPQTQPGDDQ